MGIFDRFKKKTDQKTASKKPTRPAEPSVKRESQAKKQIEKKEALGPRKTGLKKNLEAERLILKPVISEKATSLAPAGKYVFEVSPTANRSEVAKAIASIYGVRPIKINVLNMSGKEIRYGRAEGRTKNRKKMIVTLKAGESISIQDGV